MDQYKYPENWTSSDQPGERAGYVSLEKSEVYAKTAQGAFDLSGLGKVVKVCLQYPGPDLPCLDDQIVGGLLPTGSPLVPPTSSLTRLAENPPSPDLVIPVTSPSSHLHHFAFSPSSLNKPMSPS